jgi:hypothetical protein
MLQFKSANGSRASRRWAKSGKAEHISKEMSSLKVYRASRWSAIGLIGDPRPKTVLDDGRLSHGRRLLSDPSRPPGARRESPPAVANFPNGARTAANSSTSRPITS